MDINTLYGMLLAVLLSLVLMFFQGLKRKKSWKGTVIDIQRIEDEDSDGFPYTQYKIYYQTISGKKGKMNVNSREYDAYFKSIKIGSQLIKTEGKDYPELLT